MKVEPTKNGWVVALGAVLVLAGTPAMAQKKPGGGGGGTVNCATSEGFPAFIFYRTSGSSGSTYVSDRTGKCVRLLASGIHSFSNAFSHPVLDDDDNPTSRGRVVWPQSTSTTGNRYLALDFEVVGTTITVVPGSPRVVLDLGPNTPNNESHCCSIDLSRDGRTLYMSLLPIETDTTVTHRIGRLRLPTDLALHDAYQAPLVIYEAPPSPLPGQDVPYSGVTWDLSVDHDSSYLYLVRRGVDTIDELVRLDPLSREELILTGPRTTLGAGNSAIRQPYFPAAELVPGSRRVAFREWIGDTTTSDFQSVHFIDGASGAITEPAQRAYGHGLAWTDGLLLGNGFDSRGRATGSIVRIDPATGAVSTLVTGHHPQGR